MNDIVMMKPSDLILNDDNPRTIKDKSFDKLVKSVQDFPEMLTIRPIVVNKKKVVLGGNMRARASLKANLSEVPVMIVDLTEDQEREFIIKDNVSGGEWDWELLANEWDSVELEEWGLDVGGFDLDADKYDEDFTLADGDKTPFQQMTFTLADDQAELIKIKIEECKKKSEFNLIETYGNENSNGNALYALISGQL